MTASYDMEEKNKTVKGEHDVSRQYETVTHTSKVLELKLKHPRFFIRRGLGVIKYDIALLTLEQPVDFTQFPHIRQAAHQREKRAI